MTKYLIDTHILIWLAVSPTKISKNIIKIIENTDNKICVSSISFWEIAIKISIGKLSLQGLNDTLESIVNVMAMLKKEARSPQEMDLIKRYIITINNL